MLSSFRPTLGLVVFAECFLFAKCFHVDTRPTGWSPSARQKTLAIKKTLERLPGFLQWLLAVESLQIIFYILHISLICHAVTNMTHGC
jgi:hypothetical protein